MLAASIVFAGIGFPGISASATEVCLADFQDSDWKLGQPDRVFLNSNLILSKASVDFVNLNGEYFKKDLQPESLRVGVLSQVAFNLSRHYLLDSTSRLRFEYVYEGKSCITRTVQFEISGSNPSLEFSMAELDVWANNLRVPDVFGPLNFKESALAKEIFIKAREYVSNNPKVSIKYRDYEAVKNLTFDDYRENERFEFPQSTIRDGIQSLITSNYKSENPAYLKNLKHIFLQLQAYSPDGCIRFHINDIIRQQLGIIGKDSLYSPQMFGFYYFPKKQNCKLNLVYLNQKSEAIPLGQMILEPVIERSSSTLGKKVQTITCVKGKVTKKVTAVNPKCPTGYKKAA